ncbi:MAG: DUF488 domain-containing protein [Pseudomonadota bacterium]
MFADPIFTVGHSNRPLPELIDILQSAKIKTLIDVRRFPASRRYPHFNAGSLKQALTLVGIAYRHFPELGGYREPPVERSSPNDGWTSGFLRNYADYAMTAAFQAAFDRLQQSLRPRAVLMCAEKSWADCHRQIIADYLIANGHSVVHVIDATTHEVGTLTTFATRSEEDTICYPATKSQLELDF